MEGRLGNAEQAVTLAAVTLRRSGERLLVAALVSFVAMAPAAAQFFGEPPVRYGNTSSWFYDGRDDQRDFPTNGFFPGNFAANPFYAQNGGASGFLGSNPQRSATPYPSKTFVRFGRDCRDYGLLDALNGRRCARAP